MENYFFVLLISRFRAVKENKLINERTNDIFVCLLHRNLSPYQPKVSVCLHSMLVVTVMRYVLQVKFMLRTIKSP